MNSDTWFPERLVSDSCVSSRFSILLNCVDTQSHKVQLKLNIHTLSYVGTCYFSPHLVVELHLNICGFTLISHQTCMCLSFIGVKVPNTTYMNYMNRKFAFVQLVSQTKLPSMCLWCLLNTYGSIVSQYVFKKSSMSPLSFMAACILII